MRRSASNTSILTLATCLLWGANAMALDGPPPPPSSSETTSIEGMSRDGSVYLERYRIPAVSIYGYRLVSLETGEKTEITIDAERADSALLSADGTAVLVRRQGSDEQYLWRPDGSSELLASGDGSSILAMNADGSAFVGRSTDGSVRFWYRQSSDGQDVTIFQNDGNFAWFDRISADGTTVVGSIQQDGVSRAARWNRDTRSLEVIDNEFARSNAQFVSDDGSVVSGSGRLDLDQGDRVFRWSAATGTMIDIDPNQAWRNMNVFAMSGDGDVLAGNAIAAAPGSLFQLYRYVASTNTSWMLGTLGGNDASFGALSGNGQVIVGQSSDSDGIYHGFRWSEQAGMITVDQWLANAGQTLAVATQDASFVSDDGSIVAGQYVDGNSYIARVSATGTGIINPEAYFPTVAAANSVTLQHGTSSANTIMFGAQGNPMRNLLNPGQRSVWGTVDGGYDDSNSSKGGLALGDFGFGYGLAEGVTARFSLGGVFTDQNLTNDGSIIQRGFYLSPEVTAALGHDIYATVGGYWGRSSIDIQRGYRNGAALDFSQGDTHAETWGAKIRFDWLDAATIAGTNITPYAGVSYARTTLDAYTETGGAFPVSYAGTSDHSTIARLGTDFVHPLNDTVRLLAKAEADYQFENRSAGTSGTVIGLSDFTLAGQELKQFWVRGGLGTEFDVGAGAASFMVNATTQGQETDIWVRSNYTVKF